MMCAEFLSERLFVVTAVDGYGLKAHAPGVLNAEVSQSADAVHCNDVSAPGAGIAQRVVDRNARTHERPSLLCRQIVWNCCESRSGRNHVLAVTSIEIDAGDLTIDAHGKVAAPAQFAHETVSTMPAHTHSLSFLPRGDIAGDRIDASGDLMAWHTWILNPWKNTFFDDGITMANAARLYFHSHLTVIRLWDIAFYQFKGATSLAYLRHLHFAAHKILLWVQ